MLTKFRTPTYMSLVLKEEGNKLFEEDVAKAIREVEG